MCAIKGTLDKVKRRVKRRLFPLSLAFFFFFLISCLTCHLLFCLFPSQIIEARFLRYEDIHTGDVMQVSS